MNYTGPKVRNSRKIGVPMTAKAGKIMSSDKAGRKSPPGQHGSTKRRGKLSVYGTQLFEKQKLRLQYNIHERQMTNYFKKAAHLTGNTGDILLQMLETRLDALVFRSGLARSMASARQYVNHGHFLVNGKPVNISRVNQNCSTSGVFDIVQSGLLSQIPSSSCSRRSSCDL
jgi:small subunit ribosomal protein S4